MAFHLFTTKTIRLAADRRVKMTITYVPTTLPSNTNPSYDISAIDINKKYLKEMSGEDISGIHGGGKVPEATGRPWNYGAGYARIENVKIGHHQNKHLWGGEDMDIKWLNEKLNPKCTTVNA